MLKYDFSNYKFRCHSLGLIMTEPKGKSNKVKYDELLEKYAEAQQKYNDIKNKETKTAENALAKLISMSNKLEELLQVVDVPCLSETCKSHLAEIYIECVYGRTKDIKGKYLEKGLLLEEDSITQYSLVKNLFHKKNHERKENDFLSGEMDFEDDIFALDVKTSWDIFTFTSNRKKKLNPIYAWQVRGYMWLWDKKRAKVIHSLLNTPEHMLKIEEKHLLYDFVGSEEDYKLACKELRFNHTYDDIDINERIKEFIVERDEDLEAKIALRVEECRKYLNEFDNEIEQEDETED